jgi:hypothetical protein
LCNETKKVLWNSNTNGILYWREVIHKRVLSDRLIPMVDLIVVVFLIVEGDYRKRIDILKLNIFEFLKILE